MDVSDDKVTKTAIGGRDQAEYLIALGIGPSIYVLDNCSYTMERLYHEPLNGIQEFEIFGLMIRILRTRVWCRLHAQNNWHQELKTWVPSISPSMNIDLFMKELFYKKSDVGIMIHGDPTLSNVMMDNDGMLKFIDPIRPVKKIPWMMEVDIGKMFQSLIGWEHVVFGWDMPDASALDLFYMIFTETELRKSLFWLMIHAMRIIPYAKGRNDDAYLWASDVYQYIYKNLMEKEPCDTLTILMERSRKLGPQCWPHIVQ